MIWSYIQNIIHFDGTIQMSPLVYLICVWFLLDGLDTVQQVKLVGPLSASMVVTQHPQKKHENGTAAFNAGGRYGYDNRVLYPFSHVHLVRFMNGMPGTFTMKGLKRVFRPADSRLPSIDISPDVPTYWKHPYTSTACILYGHVTIERTLIPNSDGVMALTDQPIKMQRYNEHVAFLFLCDMVYLIFLTVIIMCFIQMFRSILRYFNVNV